MICRVKHPVFEAITRTVQPVDSSKRRIDALKCRCTAANEARHVFDEDYPRKKPFDELEKGI